ncbi:MAG: GAF domain-containing protein [Chloroflexi bacterium]|nr:GAF domain-containing protein [Chloroflexota bacterium]
MNDPDRMKRSPTVSAQSRWAQVILALSALGTYGLMFFPTYHWMGRAATTLAVLPVAMFGWLLGMRGGLLAALFCLLSNMILLNLVGQPGWEVMIHTGGGSLGAIALVLIGGIVGRMSDLGRRAERELAARKRAEEERARLLEQQQCHVERLAVLYETARATTDVQDLRRLLGRALERILTHLPADAASVYLRDQDGDALVLAAQSGFSSQNVSHFIAHRVGDSTVTGQAAARGKVIFIEDTAAFPYTPEVRQIVQQDGIVSHAAVPLCSEASTIGVLNVAWRTHHCLDAEALSLLEGLADILTGGVLNARLLQETRRRAEELEALTRLSREIAIVPELHPALTLIARHAAELSGSDAGGVFAFGPDERLHIVAAHGVGNEFVAALNALGVPPGHGAIGRAAAERRPIQIPDVLTESAYPFSQLADMEHIRSILAVPMLRGEHAEGEVIGGIVLWHRQTRHFTPHEEAFVQALAQQCVNAVENARLFESERAAREQAETLRQVAQVMSGSLELENVLHRILGQLKRVLTYDTASVLLLGEADQHALVAGIGYADEQSTSRAAGELLRDSPILRQMANDLRLVNIAEVRDHPGWTWVPGAEHVRSFLAVPIVAHHRMIGALMVDSTHPGLFKESDAHTAQTLAQHMAIAIENARRYEETRQQAAELAVLAGASRSIQSGGDLPEVLDAVLRQACDLVNVPTGSILLLDENGDRLRVAAQRGLDAQAVAEWNRTGIPRTFGTFALVLGTGEMLEIPDARHDPRAAAGYGPIPEALTNVPLLAKGRVIGILVIEGVSRDDSTRRVLRTLAEMAGVAIERARLFDETRRHAEELESLAEVASAMRTARTVEEMLPLLVRKAAEVIGGAAGSIFLVEPGTGDLVSRGWLAASDGWRFTSDASLTLRHRPGEGVTGHVAATGEIYITRDLQHDPLAVFLPGEEERLRAIQSGISLPLHTQARIIGVLHIWRHEDRAFDETEVRLLTSIAEMAGNAIHRAALYEQTERDAVELALAYDTTIEGWSKALDLRDKETEGHTLRVTELTERLACNMGMSKAELVHIHRGALLHDIGKMGVPDSILLKAGQLTDEEWVIMRQHPQFACDMLSPIAYLRSALDIPFCHHEKWDGTGYPRGLKGEEIPLAARLFAVVDVYDALRSDRPYRAAWPEEKVREYIREQAGRHFDPKVLDAFLRLLDEKKA